MDVDIAALEELFVEIVLVVDVFVFELGLLLRCDSLGI